MYSGKSNESRRVYRFFQDLKAGIVDRYHIQDIRFLMVPGNHDIDYDGGDLGRKGLETVERDNCYDQELVNEKQKQQQFYRLSERYHCFSKTRMNLLHQKTIMYGNKKIQVNLINTAVFSSKDEDQGFHYLPEKDIERLSEQNDADFIISVMHHPHHWYTWRCKKKLEDAIYSRSDLIFVGHEHFESDMTVSKDKSIVNIFAAGELCNQGDWTRSEFHIGILDLNTREYSSHRYRFNCEGVLYEGVGEERKLILSKDRFNKLGWKVSEGFLNTYIYEDKHNISRSFMDYFVFPLLEVIPNENQSVAVTREIKSLTDFMSRLKTEPYVNVSGLLESGKTVLSRAIFLELAKEYQVIYVHGGEVGRDYEKTIKKAFEETYGSGSTKYESFKQTLVKSRAIVIDDFDIINSTYQEAFLEYVIDNFGTIIETSQEEIELDIENRIKKNRINEGFLRLRIAPFYIDKRRELVKKVVDIIGNDGQSKDSIIDVLCDALTRQKYLYNWSPDFIVQFTKYYYNNIGDSTKNDGNVFSKVFENSIISLIKPFTGNKLTVDKVFTILDKIAYKIYIGKEYPISSTVISGVIDDYNDVYDSDVNALNLLQSLISAKIFKEANSGYLFYERSYLAYFTAREIRKQVYDGNYDMLKHVMEYSYMNLNADILLFVTYITENRNIIIMLMDLAEATVSKWEEFSLSPVNIPYLTGTAQELIKPVGEGDREKEEERHIEQEKAETTAMTLANDSSIFDGESEELSFIQEMMRSISLMITLARALPSFEHLLEKAHKDKCVELIYTMPLRIFYVWASQVNEVRSEMVQMIKEFHEWEYRKDKPDSESNTVDKALFALRWESVSLLLELMHSAIAYSTRENTWKFIDRFDYKSKITYSVEHLMGYVQQDAVKSFTDETVRLIEEKTPLTKLIIKRISRNFMLNSKRITTPETQRLNQKVFEGNIKQNVLLIEQNKNKKKE